MYIMYNAMYSEHCKMYCDCCEISWNIRLVWNLSFFFDTDHVPVGDDHLCDCVRADERAQLHLLSIHRPPLGRRQSRLISLLRSKKGNLKFKEIQMNTARSCIVSTLS